MASKCPIEGKQLISDSFNTNEDYSPQNAHLLLAIVSDGIVLCKFSAICYLLYDLGSGYLSETSLKKGKIIVVCFSD